MNEPLREMSEQIAEAKRLHGEVIREDLHEAYGYFRFYFVDGYELQIEIPQGEDYGGVLTL